VQIGGEVLRETADKVGEAQVLSYGDEHLEAKLFPYGKGSWYWKKNALTIGKYHKMRLMHFDRRWANDRFYSFFTFDRNIKQRLFLPKMFLLLHQQVLHPQATTYHRYGEHPYSELQFYARNFQLFQRHLKNQI
jgi:hypothetical protein